MDICTTLKKLTAINARADEFISANAPLLLKKHRNKLVDLCTVALMGYEDHVFHWDQLRNIAHERVGLFEHGRIPWFIDIDRSTSTVVTIGHDDGQRLQIEVGQLLLTSVLSIH